MVEEAYLVIDFGTGGAKCVVFDTRGHPVFKAFSPIDFQFIGPSAKFNVKESWTRVSGMIRQAVAASAKRGKIIVAVSSTSMREGNVFYDSRGRELLAVPNVDGRAEAEAKKIAAASGELIYSKSGHWPNAMFLICRLRWLREHEAGIFRKIAKVSMVNDWVLYKLSGQLVSEPTNACETAAFDLRSRNWSEELVEELGIDPSILPSVVECGTVLGHVGSKVSRSTGLDPSTKVVVGAADTEAALVGCGAFDEGSVVAVAGSTTPVQAITSSVTTDRRRRTWSCCHAMPGRWTVESNAGATGLVFDWWSRIVGADYSTLDKEAANYPLGSSGIRAMMGSSIFNARVIGAFQGALSGISPWMSRGSISRALIETACFAVRGNLEQVEEVTKMKYENLIFCGGCARSNLWTRIQADILNRIVIRHRLGDATPRGAAMLCSVAVGQFHDVRKASSVFTEPSLNVLPNQRNRLKYENEYKSWLSVALPAGRAVNY